MHYLTCKDKGKVLTVPFFKTVHHAMNA